MSIEAKRRTPEDDIKFSFRDKNEKEKSIGNVEQKLEVDIESLAEKFLKGLVDIHLYKKAATQLTSFQNTIIRLINSGKIQNFEAFFQKLKQATAKNLEKYRNKLKGVPIQEIYRDIDGMERSVIHITKHVIPDIKKSFKKKQEDIDEDIQHVIGINNELDSKHGIDLVEIQYKESIDGVIDVLEIKFIQAKSSAFKSKTKEREEKKQFDLHIGFLDTLNNHEQSESINQERRLESISKYLLDQLGIKDIKEATKTINEEENPKYEEYEEKLLMLAERYETLIEKYRKNINKYKGDIQKSLQQSLKETNISEGEIIAILKNPNFFKLFYNTIRSFSMDPPDNENIDNLQKWAKTQPITREHLKHFNIEVEPLIESKKYTSVIYAGLDQPKESNLKK